MKYLKTYETSEWIPKYKVGDYVRIIGNDGKWKSDPCRIKKVGNITDFLTWGKQTLNSYLLDTLEGGHIWRCENALELVPDFELKATKYNL